MFPHLHGHFYHQHHAQHPHTHHQAHGLQMQHEPMPTAGPVWLQQGNGGGSGGGGDPAAQVLRPHLQHQHHHHAAWTLADAPTVPLVGYQHLHHHTQAQHGYTPQHVFYVANYLPPPPPPPPPSAQEFSAQQALAGAAVSEGETLAAHASASRRGQQRRRRGQESGRAAVSSAAAASVPPPLASSDGAPGSRMPPPMPVLPSWPAVRVGGPAVDAPAELPAADRARPERYKTALCRHFARQSSCMLGAGCRFAHGECELRTEADNVARGVTTEAAVATLVARRAAEEAAVVDTPRQCTA